MLLFQKIVLHFKQIIMDRFEFVLESLHRSLFSSFAIYSSACSYMTCILFLSIHGFCREGWTILQRLPAQCSHAWEHTLLPCDTKCHPCRNCSILLYIPSEESARIFCTLAFPFLPETVSLPYSTCQYNPSIAKKSQCLILIGWSKSVYGSSLADRRVAAQSSKPNFLM